MSEKQGIDGLLAEIADEAEAAEHTTEPDAPLPDHVKVSRPGRARSKVLQVRLNPDEMAAIEAIAERRGLPVSTVARDQLLRLLTEDPDRSDPLCGLLDAADHVGRFADMVREVLHLHGEVLHGAGQLRVGEVTAQLGSK